jgi:hypothetical protein
MADFLFNIAKGRGVEFMNRVDSNDPAASTIVLVPLSQSGTEAQGQDLDTLALVEADANFAERTSGSWVRKTLTDANVTFPAPDDANNRYAVALPSVTWTAPTAGNDTTGLLVCYSPSAGADSTIIPISHHDFVVTTDGNDVVLNAGDFLRAS